MGKSFYLFVGFTGAILWLSWWIDIHDKEAGGMVAVFVTPPLVLLTLAGFAGAIGDIIKRIRGKRV